MSKAISTRRGKWRPRCSVSYPVLFDARKDVSRAYQASTMPLTVLIDREGVVRYVSEGYKVGYEARYTDKLRELLNE